jgi:glycerate kinase
MTVSRVINGESNVRDTTRELVMEAVDFDEKLGRADVVVTGEGRIDEQTAFGKTALGVARRAQAAGVRCLAVGGGVTADGIEALATVGAISVPVVEHPQTVDEAMAAGIEPVERCGARIASLVSLGQRLAASSAS